MAERIVVGFDRKDESHPALQWAAREAQLRGAVLEVVVVWNRTQFVVGHPEADTEIEIETIRAAVEGEVHRHLDGFLPDHLQITVASDDRPAHALSALSALADMLVIGSRGLSPSVGTALGSVGQQLIETAECPLVIIPPRGRARATAQFSRDDLEAARRAALES